MRLRAHAALSAVAVLLFGGGAAASAEVPAAAVQPPAQASAPPIPPAPGGPAVQAAGAVPLERNLCPTPAGPVALGSAQWNGWGPGLDNTRYQPEPAIRAADVAKLALKWTFGSQSGTDFGQPTVVDGRVFATSSAGRVYSLDAKTGCTYWTYDAAAGVHSAVTIGELAPQKIVALPRKLKRTLAHLDVIKAPSAAYFGGDGGMVYAVDAQKGTLLWKVQADTHPSARIVAAPTLYNDRLYVAVASTEDLAAADPKYPCCTFRGSVSALDIATGRTVWKSYTVLEEPVPTSKNAAGIQEFGPAGAAVSSSPSIDAKRNVLYVATGGTGTGLEQSLTDAVVALDLADGKLRWVKQLSRPDASGFGAGFTSSPVLRNLATGAQILLAGQRSGVVYGLDPDHGGEILWQSRINGRTSARDAAGGIAWGAAADYRNLYVALSGLLAQPANPSGSLTALDMTTGAERWHTASPMPPCTGHDHGCSHAQAQAVTVMPGIVFSGSMDGHLRAYSTIDGRIRWDFDTARDFQTKNGIKVSGGPLDRGGATIVNGTVYINSGNALLAFSVDGK